MLLNRLVFVVAFFSFAWLSSPDASSQTVRSKRITRLFWQDRETQQLSYADLVASGKWGLQRGWVKGFPKLDSEKQHLSQMQSSGGVVMVAVSDGDQGKSQSGWVAFDSGVFEEPHGNHFHWRYTRTPTVGQSKLDSQQGNPSRVYDYNNTFYVPTSSKTGFVQAVPGSLKISGSAKGVRSYTGGGGRTSLAAVNGSVCYATWSDDDGENAGRVDVVNLKKPSDQPVYSFRLPSGAIHSATANAGKVFFATGNGVYWVSADTSLTGSAETVQVNTVALDSNAASSTGELTNEGSSVIFTAGTADLSTICIVNAAFSTPAVTKLPISVAEGLRLANLRTVLSLGKRYAFVFQERVDPASDVKEQLTVVELDPNRDRSFNDARVKATMPVGASKVNGDYGHHDITFDAYGRYAVLTNPGDGALTLMSVSDLRVRARFLVSGVPDNIIAVGASEHFH